MNNALFSSNKMDWETPTDLYNQLNNKFHFDLDPCASDANHKCKYYFTTKENGLLQDWGNYGNVFCNPPYGQTIAEWVRKCHMEAMLNPDQVICLLIPARTDTRYFHDFIYKCEWATTYFIKGRLHFEVNGVQSKVPAPFPSMVVIFNFKEANND